MRHFSEYRYEIKKLAKKANSDWETICESFFSKHTDNELNQMAIESVDASLSLNAWLAEYKALKYGCKHYFVTGEGMEQWLSSSAPKLIKEKFETFYSSFEGENVSVIHFEGSKSGAYLFMLGQDLKNKLNTIHVFKTEHNQSINLKVFSREDDFENIYNDEEIAQCVNVVSGLLSYIECFPDAVKDGVPEDIKHPAHFKGITACVVNGSRVIGERGSVTPHFRNGHFRVLRSEKFTKKRHQVIFVRECFVKGHAKTVDGFES